MYACIQAKLSLGLGLKIQVIKTQRRTADGEYFAGCAGDVQPVAERVAKAVGIPWGNIHAGVKPGGKAALIQKLQSQGHK